MKLIRMKCGDSDWKKLTNGKLFSRVKAPAGIGVVKSNIRDAYVIGNPGEYGTLEIEYTNEASMAWSGLGGVTAFLATIKARYKNGDDVDMKMLKQYTQMVSEVEGKMKELKRMP